MMTPNFEFHDSQWDVIGAEEDSGDAVLLVNEEIVTFPKDEVAKYRDGKGVLSIEGFHEMAWEAIDEISKRCV